MTDLTRILNVFKYEWRSPWEVKHMTFSNFDTTICSKWSNFDTTISFVFLIAVLSVMLHAVQKKILLGCKGHKRGDGSVTPFLDWEHRRHHRGDPNRGGESGANTVLNCTWIEERRWATVLF
ncbi:hypothetical protein HanRHA438_Chr15g0695151 [Helianthus annuus]|nr:hypothetical protein HanRHA438_Chr15g0695151 [Helianthus annuus]